MIKKYQSPIPGHVRVVFELPSCLWADRIYLSGDFNNWCADDIELRQDRNGVWRAMLDLPVGRHFEFRYVIDGEWRTDFHADGQASNLYGSQNSLVIAEFDAEEQVGHRHGTQVRVQARAQARERQLAQERTVPAVHRRQASAAAVEPSE